MKIKNPYICLCIFWIIITLCNTLTCVLNFVADNLFVGFCFLVISVAVSFVSGVLLTKAIEIHNYNKACDFLHDIHEFLKEQEIESIKPFEELEND